jgi:hypothetical protein
MKKSTRRSRGSRNDPCGPNEDCCPKDACGPAGTCGVVDPCGPNNLCCGRNKSGERDCRENNHHGAVGTLGDPKAGAAGAYCTGAAGTGTGAACAVATDVRLEASAIAHAADAILHFAVVLIVISQPRTSSVSL